MNDLDRITEILDTYNSLDKEVILYDYFSVSDDKNIYSLASCYSITESGIDKMIMNIESDKLNVIDQYWSRFNYNTYFYTKDISKEVYIEHLVDFDISNERIAVHIGNEKYLTDEQFDVAKYDKFYEKIE